MVASLSLEKSYHLELFNKVSCGCAIHYILKYLLPSTFVVPIYLSSAPDEHN